MTRVIAIAPFMHRGRVVHPTQSVDVSPTHAAQLVRAGVAYEAPAGAAPAIAAPPRVDLDAARTVAADGEGIAPVLGARSPARPAPPGLHPREAPPAGRY